MGICQLSVLKTIHHPLSEVQQRQEPDQIDPARVMYYGRRLFANPKLHTVHLTNDYVLP